MVEIGGWQMLRRGHDVITGGAVDVRRVGTMLMMTTEEAEI